MLFNDFIAPEVYEGSKSFKMAKNYKNESKWSKIWFDFVYINFTVICAWTWKDALEKNFIFSPKSLFNYWKGDNLT